MYNYNFFCTYHLLDKDALEHTDEVEGINEMKHICYQSQFLQAFNTDTYDDNIINKTTQYLYDELKDTESFKSLISKIKIKFKNNLFLANMNEDKELVCFLFSYDYFHKFHNEYINFKLNNDYDFSNILTI